MPRDPPPRPSAATAVLRDLLEALGPAADAVLTEVLAGRDVRSLRVVGPLEGTDTGWRYSVVGLAGLVSLHGRNPTLWAWQIAEGAYAHAPARTPGQSPPRGRDTAPTRLAADRALCLALRELGWAPVEVPTEDEVREAAERELPRTLEYLRTDAELRSEVQRRASSYDELDTATGEDLDRLAEQVGVRRQPGRPPVMEGSPEDTLNVSVPAPTRTFEDVVPGINAQLEADRAEIRRRGQGVDYGLVLDPTAAPTAHVTDDGRALEFSGLTPAQVEVLQRQVGPISTHTRDPALYALLQVVRLADGTSLWAYLDAADRRLLVMESIVVDPIP